MKTMTKASKRFLDQVDVLARAFEFRKQDGWIIEPPTVIHDDDSDRMVKIIMNVRSIYSSNVVTEHIMAHARIGEDEKGLLPDIVSSRMHGSEEDMRELMRRTVFTRRPTG